MRGLIHESGAAQRLWLTVARNCHHKLVVSYQLYANYRDKVRAGRRQAGRQPTLDFSGVVDGIALNADKTIWVDPEGSPLAQLVRHLNDRYLANIAHAAVTQGKCSECLLVTTDRRTREDFNRSQMNELGISGVTIEAALLLAREPR